jgi:glycosyltransferase involved in cell wall biosynthesis
VALQLLFWSTLGALLWTHVGYPLAAAAAARLHSRPIHKRDSTPAVTLIVAAHDEEAVIGRRVDNLLALDYPPERVEIVIASDGSADRTDEVVAEIAMREPRVTLLRCERRGKVAAQDAAVRGASGDILAFSDANAVWAPDALRKLVRGFADPEIAYVCGRLELEQSDGTSREGLYWRYELWLRENESRLAGITGGNGAIYAVRREDYGVASDPRLGHDLGFPYLLAQRGRRSVYEPEAVAIEKAPPESEHEYGRRVRMHAQGWLHLLSGRMLRGGGPVFLFQLLSHRILRYGSGLLHLGLFASSAALASRGSVYAAVFAAQILWLALAVAGRYRLPVPGAAIAYYYLAVTSATVAGLIRCLWSGAPAVWDKPPGTR